MKKIIVLLSLTLLLFLSLNVSAQKNDGFFSDYNNESSNKYELYDVNSDSDDGFEQNRAPLGNGILLLSAMGIAYCVGKYRHRH